MEYNGSHPNGSAINAGSGSSPAGAVYVRSADGPGESMTFGAWELGPEDVSASSTLSTALRNKYEGVVTACRISVLIEVHMMSGYHEKYQNTH
jgi:hypothetical protein